MAEGFLGRWSRRKADLREGREVEADPPLPPQEAEGVPSVAAPVQPAAPPQPAEATPLPPPPTLDDVRALTADADFSRFVAPDVAPEVKNAAMKKLFADPRYNVMDGMDVYIDDYSKPDPLPESMLRQLASAKFLGMFADEEKEGPAVESPPRDVADDPTAQSVAQSDEAALEVTQPPIHADPDLRLQPDDAAPGEEPGDGPR